MGKNYEVSENQNLSAEKPFTKSDALQNELRESRKNGNLTADKKINTSKDALPNLSFTDGTTEPEDGMHEEILPNGNRLIYIESNGRKSEFEYDSQNRPTRYKDFYGEEYFNSDPSSSDGGLWLSKTNKIQDKSNGYKIIFDTKTGTTIMNDTSTGTQVATDASGTETVTFSSSNAKLVKSLDGGRDKIEMFDASGTRRSMHVQNNKLIDYTDENGVTYTRADEATIERDKEGNLVGTYKFTAAKDGVTIPGEFNASADSSGTVMVRDLTKCDQGADDACKRMFLNGNVAVSDKDGATRTLRSVDGTVITTTTDSKTKLMLSKKVVKPDGSVVEATFNDGVLNTLTTTSPDGQINNYRKINISADTLVSRSIMQSSNSGFWLKDGYPTGESPYKLIDTSDVEESPRLIQKTPANVDLKAELEEAQKHKVDIGLYDSYNNGMWFYKSVNYGGVYDFKSPATRITNESGETVVIKDQLGRPEYEDFGNWNYALMGRECGFTQLVLEREAGAAQIDHGTSKPEWGDSGFKITKGVRIGGTGTYGDDPQDNKMIKQGYSDYDAVKNEQNPVA